MKSNVWDVKPCLSLPTRSLWDSHQVWAPASRQSCRELKGTLHTCSPLVTWLDGVSCSMGHRQRQHRQELCRGLQKTGGG